MAYAAALAETIMPKHVIDEAKSCTGLWLHLLSRPSSLVILGNYKWVLLCLHSTLSMLVV